MKKQERLTNFIKYNRAVYKSYYYIFSLLLKACALFIKTDNKLILFNSYAGRKYDDSPKELFEAIKNDRRFKGYNLVWAFHEPENHNVEGAKKIKTSELAYFITALKARVWITNSSMERGLKFKKKKTTYLNTWHGTPIKLMGNDISNNNQSFKGLGVSKPDITVSQGKYETEVFSRAFNIPKDSFLEVGLPRNDILANYSYEYRQQIRKNLGIEDDRIAILYCPTFREYDKDKHLGVIMKPPINIEEWANRLGDKYVMMIRAHYEVSRVMDIKESSFVRNMTEYKTLNELFIASDILISDYSSAFFDYSIMGKPMLHFCYDYDDYVTNRGLYFDIRKELSGAETEESLIGLIKNIDIDIEKEKCKKFREKYVQQYGHATERVLDALYKRLMFNSHN